MSLSNGLKQDFPRWFCDTPYSQETPMETRLDRAVEIQRRYYTDTATRYDSMHAHEGATDASITKFAHAIIRMLEIRSVLDVGTATGRGMRELKDALPELFVCGVEPVAALVEEAVRSGNTSSCPILRATGEALPFLDASFDAVCEFSILHHAPDPNAVVKEMLRVAKKAIFICDSNRFGQGSVGARLIKLALYKSKLWGAYNYLRTGGKGYRITEGDGLSYSYSVYDSFDLLARWADRVILIPCTGGKGTSWLHPLLTSGSVLVCALKEWA
jgi:ubiquinone/menaquinone biosynthesis C-methylase UbiE